MDDVNFKIKKTSRVNDLTEEYVMGVECIKPLPPGEREKWTLVVSDNPQHVVIKTRMPTMNGLAEVEDEKRLVQVEKMPFPMLLQTLTIRNKETDKSYQTMRYFIPIDVDEVEAVTEHRF